ncbi:hypothetical protein F5Y16DRAFT_128603 [Xylariaceae sp. FL0255]|nr:hypothetical protein F5Y16DRAFT_128603 [Xylariaceae sp. FL0255]
MSSANSAEYVGWKVEVFIGVFTPLVILLVALRFYARSLTTSRYALEDWLVLAALFAYLAETGLFIGSLVQAGVGYHVEYLEETRPEQIPTFLQYLVAQSIWYLATIWISKVSVCILYRRLFPGRVIYITLCIIVALMLATSLATVLALFFACRPFSANWASPAVQATHCINKEPIFVWGTLPNVLTDTAMLIMPLPIIWKLHMATNFKIALTVTFLIGSLGLVTSILRISSFANNNSFTDATFNAATLQIVTLAEMGIYVISACLVVCRPLLEKIRGGEILVWSSQRRGATSSGRTGDYELGRAPYGRQRDESQKLSGKDTIDDVWTDVENSQTGLRPAQPHFIASATSYGAKTAPKLSFNPTMHSNDTGITRTTIIQQSWDRTE